MFSLSLAGLGLLALLCAVFFPAQALIAVVGYGIAFLAYNWSGALRYK